MADEITLGLKTQKAGQAQALLENELLRETFKTLHDEYINAWKITHFKNVEARERLWTAIQIIGKVQDHIKKLIIDGRIASKDLAAIKTLKR